MHYNFRFLIVIVPVILAGAPSKATDLRTALSDRAGFEEVQRAQSRQGAETPDTNVRYAQVDTPEPLGEGTNLAFGLRMPVSGEDVRLLSGFGVRYHPLLKTPKMHNGLDLSAPRGTPVVAASDGVIEFAKRKGMYGLHVELRHDGVLRTTYSHLHRIEQDVVAGTRVKRGQIIGQLGSTGLTSSPHLHFEVQLQGTPIDPLLAPTKTRPSN